VSTSAANDTDQAESREQTTPSQPAERVDDQLRLAILA